MEFSSEFSLNTSNLNYDFSVVLDGKTIACCVSREAIEDAGYDSVDEFYICEKIRLGAAIQRKLEQGDKPTIMISSKDL
jgi:hypothetical protein